MFTFVIWVIGLGILAAMGLVNLTILVAAFQKHAMLGILCLAASLIGWPILLALIF